MTFEGDPLSQKRIKGVLVGDHLNDSKPNTHTHLLQLTTHLTMSIPLPGTYRLRNVHYPNQMFDLEGGSANDGTPVIGYANNNNTQNMLVSVDSLTQRLGLTISIVDLASC